MPATVLHRAHDEQDAIGRARQAAETTQCFITAMDALKLDQRAVDEVQPLISDVMDRLNKCEGLPSTFEGTTALKAWLVTFNSMRAADALSDEQVSTSMHFLLAAKSQVFTFAGGLKMSIGTLRLGILRLRLDGHAHMCRVLHCKRCLAALSGSSVLASDWCRLAVAHGPL